MEGLRAGPVDPPPARAIPRAQSANPRRKWESIMPAFPRAPRTAA